MRYWGMEDAQNNWNQVDPDDVQMYLTLFIFSMGKTLKLNRKSITIGGSKFRDLDLKELFGGKKLNPHHGTLYGENGAWWIRIEEGQTGTCLNGSLLTPGTYPVKEGDCLMLNDTVLFTIRECGFQLVDRSRELDEDFCLESQSVSGSNIHGHHIVSYNAARRVIIREDWEARGDGKGSHTKNETPVPDHIKTKKQLYQFAGVFSYPTQNQKLREDVVLWLDNDEEVLYEAEKQRVVSRTWEPGPDGPEDMQEEERIPRETVRDETELRNYVRRCCRSFSHNRSDAMDEDVTWVTNYKKYRYCAEKRAVFCENNNGFGESSLSKESLPIPLTVWNEDEMHWYVRMHKPEWAMMSIHEDKMFRDAVLQTGRFKVNGQPLRYETKYHAESRCVSHTRWDENQKQVSRDERRIPSNIYKMADVVEHVKKNYAYWIN